MKLLPWRRVSDWRCIACGECCRQFTVALQPDEIARLLRLFSRGVIEVDLGKVYIRRAGGRCVFQYPKNERWLCALQGMKPIACMLWPFLPLKKPKYGRPEEAYFEHGGEAFHIYVDARCRGLSMGRPARRLVETVLPETVEIAARAKRNQVHTTSGFLDLRSSFATARAQPPVRSIS